MRLELNVTGERRKELVHALENYTGMTAVYKYAPTFEYAVDNYIISKDGTITGPDMAKEEKRKLISVLAEYGFTVEDENEGTPDCLTISIPKNTLSPASLDRLKASISSKATVLKMAFDTDSLEIMETEDSYQFPWFTLDKTPGEGQAYADFVCAMVRHANEGIRVSAVEKPTTNPKYTLRMYMVTLNLFGDQYKNTRKVVLHRLSGNGAWRDGKKPEKKPSSPQPTVTDIELPTVQEGESDEVSE